MNSQTDQQLLREFSGGRSEAAFAELVRRHVDLVYSAALRMVRDTHLAEDVTQGVFVALTQNAGQLAERASIAGWLHRTAQNLAANVVRSDVRRRAREQEAAVMNELLSGAPDATWDRIAPHLDATWDRIAPHLDAALGELSDGDREAVLLRYFQRKSAGEMAQILGISDEAAQKRVSRAMERLREFFAERGVAVGASGLVLVISTNAVQAAPAALAATISASALIGGATLATTATATATATKAIVMTAFQKALITVAITAAVGTGIYEAHQASALRSEVQKLEQQQAPLTEQVAALTTENERLSRLAAQAGSKNPGPLPPAQLNELLKLRGKATVARQDSNELADLKSSLGDFLTNAIGKGFSTADKWKQKDAIARVARMKKMLNLTDNQEQAIQSILTNHIQAQSQLALEMATSRLTSPQQQVRAAALGDPDAEIKALLTPEQQAGYPEYQQAEKKRTADAAARSEVSEVADKFPLSKEQQENLRTLFYEISLADPAGGPTHEAIKEASRAGNLAEAGNLTIELQKAQLEQKLKALEGFLTPDQIATYRQSQMDHIKMVAATFKLFPASASTVGAK